MERNYSIDLVKFFAIFSVVIIHTTPFADRPIGFILNTLSRFGVAFFFSASGYLFGRKMLHSNQNLYFKKYVIKLVKIYVSWLIFYTIYDLIGILVSYHTVFQLKHAIINYFQRYTLLNFFYYGGSSSGYQLWFLPALIWSILILFAFIKIKKIKILLIISLILNIMGLFGQTYSGIIKIPIETKDAIFFGLFYTTLGFYFASNYTLIKTISLKINGNNFLFLAIIFICFQLVERLVVNKIAIANTGNNYFLSTIFVIFFLLLFVINKENVGQGLCLTEIGSNSIGIYVIHVFLLNTILTFFTYFHMNYLINSFIVNLLIAPLIFITALFTYNFIQHFKKKILNLKGILRFKNDFINLVDKSTK